MVHKRIALIWFVILIVTSVFAQERTYLVAVGVADYSSFPGAATNLRSTTNDARTIVDVYSKNGPVGYSLLLNSDATRSRIEKAITQVLGRAGENDIAVFFFSGHGYPNGICASDGPVDFDVIRSAMAKSRCKNKMMFVDACFAGGLRENDKRERQKVEALNRQASVMLFLSSRNDESSLESTGLTNGVFTTFLHKGLKGAADRNRDRIITARELYLYVHEEVEKYSSGQQHPVMWGKFSHNMPVMKWTVKKN
ncbi:MAG: caspase family protein [Bacteroides sp.]|nr:caspase family protein [Bacteroides sp.]